VIFLWQKFRFFPFTIQTVYTILLAAACFGICYFGFRNIHGITGLVLRSLAFCLLYGTSVIYFKLSPDVIPVWNTIKKRMGLSRP
jgi:hypothetical protein